MSNLSSLLNPAPSLTAQNQARRSSSRDKENQSGPGQSPKSYRLSHIEIGIPSVAPSIQSPLDALAEAATSSAPLRSPTHPAGTPFVSLDAHANASSSRPSSSRISPPVPYDHPHGSGPTSPSFMSELQQYHHPTSKEIDARRPSLDNFSSKLPPFRSSLVDVKMTENSELPEIKSRHEEQGQTTLPTLSDTLGQSDVMQDPAYDGVMTSQIRQPSSGPVIPAGSVNLPPTQSEQAEVKTELIDTPSVLPAVTLDPIEMPTESLGPSKKESATPAKLSPTPANSQPENVPSKPKLAAGRKRPGPKKGTAKPAAKRRKLGTAGNTENTPPSQRSGTPNSGRGSKASVSRNRKQSSVTPLRSSPMLDEDDDDDDDEEGGEFCICRGPDDHTWMIACDGPCEDWYHGRCVDMTQEKGDLIEKYYCPNCTAKGEGQTLWKRMCRLEGCERPARVNAPKKSKYCSDEHGLEFMRREALKNTPKLQNSADQTKVNGTSVSGKGHRNRRKDNYTDNIDNGEVVITLSAQLDGGADENGGSPRNHRRPGGGALTPGELKTLVNGVNGIGEFRALGNAMPSPPPTATGTVVNGDTMDNDKPTYTPAETAQLDAIIAKRASLRARKAMLDDREIFIGMVKERAGKVLETLRKREGKEGGGGAGGSTGGGGSRGGGPSKGKKGAGGKKDGLKDICGYDVRLSWSDVEFETWRTSIDGRGQLDRRRLDEPASLEAVPGGAAGAAPEGMAGEGAGTVTDGAGNETGGDANGRAAGEEEIGKGVCQKPKCHRHSAWFKLQGQESAFEKEDVRQGMRRLEAEEKEVRDRARIRWLEGNAEGIEDGGGRDVVNGDG
ncbi:MAG: hypothetical protein Q9167_005239 [Letrouitia subvulpina]